MEMYPILFFGFHSILFLARQRSRLHIACTILSVRWSSVSNNNVKSTHLFPFSKCKNVRCGRQSTNFKLHKNDANHNINSGNEETVMKLNRKQLFSSRTKRTTEKKQQQKYVSSSFHLCKVSRSFLPFLLADSLLSRTFYFFFIFGRLSAAAYAKNRLRTLCINVSVLFFPRSLLFFSIC